MQNRWGRSLTALLLAVTVMAGCSTGKQQAKEPAAPTKDADVDTAKLSKELNVFNWTEYLPESILKDFEKTYGVKVNYDTYSSNEEMHAKLKAGASSYDVVFPSEYTSKVLIREGLLAKLDPANIPNLANLDARWRKLPHDPNDEYTIPYFWGTTGIIVNTDKVKPESIKSWNDLWKPELKGQLVMVNDAREALAVALRTDGHGVNTTDKAALEKAKEELKALKPNIKAYNSDSPKDMMLSGEVNVGVVWSGEAAYVLREAKNFAYIIPPEGVTIWVDTVAIPKGAKNKYTAEVFLNYLLDAKVSAKLSEEFPYGNPNKAAEEFIPEDDKKNPAIFTPAEWLKKAEYLDDLGDEMNQVYDQLWTEIKG